MTLTSQDIIPLQLNITRCGYVNLNSLWNKNNGRIMHSRLYLVEEGGGYLKTETQTIFLEPGYAYLIPAGFRHAYGCTFLKKLYFMFRITAKENQDLLANVDQVCCIPYDRKDLNTLLALYEATDLLSMMTVRQILLRLICTCLQEGQIPPIHLKHNSPLVERAIAYIQSHLRINLTISEISSHLFVSESKLRATFLAETGTTIGQYIDKQVLAQAKQLLATQRRSISEISAMLGFCDQFYFSRRFKEMYLITPSAYRKDLRKKQNEK